MRAFKWGDSLAIELTGPLVEELNLKEGDELEVVAAGNRKVVVETKEQERLRAIEKIASLNLALPPGYKFDRDEANER